MAYAKASQGYRAGGFNAAAPPGHEAYDQETSWNYEAGVKSAWWQDRLIVNADVFRTCWNRLQVNSHVPGGNPSDYYIENGGKAMSQGAEVELTARPCRHVELFGGGGLLDAHYRAGSQSADAPVGGHDLPFAPRWTWQGGVQLTHDFGEHLQAFVRAELNGLSRYAYDPSNAESQGAYTLARFRAGVAAGTWRIEGWVNNAFDRQYVPLAIPYGPGYYVGECGAPRTVGASLTKTF
jgi:iron complex outermembrane receptor protein